MLTCGPAGASSVSCLSSASWPCPATNTQFLSYNSRLSCMHLVIWCLTGLSLIIPAGSGSLLSYKTKWRRCRLRLFSRHHEGCPGMAAPSAASMPAKKPCPPPSPALLWIVSALGPISLASGAPHFFPEVRVTLCAVQQRCPAAEPSGARGCISCILVTSHSRLPGHRASSSVFEKTLVKKKGLLFS